METLAIIAYHQPVTRAEIEEIRGVATAKGTLDILLETGWVRLRGRRRTPGRPVTYGTTPLFLDHFGLDAVDDLPGQDELKGAGLLDGRGAGRACRSRCHRTTRRYARTRIPSPTTTVRAASDRSGRGVGPVDGGLMARRASARDRFRLPRWGQRGTAGAAIPAQLAFENVVQLFGEVRAVDGVSLTVAPGELVCLLGHSGCGKTTLLRIAAGVEAPTAGRVLMDGLEVSGPAAFVPPELRGIGLMFQDYALFPHLSVLRNVAFGLRDLPAAAAEASARRALARVGLDRYGGEYPHTLSGGEQQRVALARSIAPRPGVLLMDEPFSNLDRRMRDAIRDETVAILRETRATTIVVTHDPEEAMRIADRIVLMRSGRIVQAGTAEEVYHRPVDLFAARFFCDFNEIEGMARNGRVATPVGDFAAPHLEDETRTIVCIRPEGVRLRGSGPSVPGRAVARRFLGEVDLVHVAVEGLDRPLQARVRDKPRTEVGHDVGVDIDRNEVLVFAASHP